MEHWREKVQLRSTESIPDIDLNVLFDLIPWGVAACDRDGRYLFANREYARIYEYAPHELIGKKFYELKTPLEKRELQKVLLDEILKDEVNIDRFVKKDLTHTGREIHVEYQSRILRSSSEPDNVLGALVFVRDVTDEMVNQSIIQRLEADSLKNQQLLTLGRMTGHITHDFNNLLTIMLGYLGLSSNEDVQYCNRILDACCKARDLTKNILSITRAGTGQRVRVCMNKLIETTVDFMKHMNRLHKNHVSIINEASSSCVLGNPSELQNALINILTNAFYAIENGGEIEISTVNDKLDAITITVKDSGSGMSPETLEKIFDPFFSTKGEDGNGFGLTITKKIITGHGGTVSVTSTLGEGTTFAMSLPTCCPKTNIHEEKKNDFIFSGKKAVIFEENSEVLPAMTASMEDMGFKVYPFANSERFAKFLICSPDTFDLAIIDLCLPSMSGIDLANEIALHRNLPPTLYTSFYSIIQSEFKHEPYFPILVKPFLKEELAALAQQVM